MKAILCCCLAVMMTACASSALRCNGHLEPINVSVPANASKTPAEATP